MDRRRFIAVGGVTTLVPTLAFGQDDSGLLEQGVGLRMTVNNIADIPRQNGSIPYASYTLFIATQYSYRPEVSSTLTQAFDAFGDAIGDDNLAVFVTNQTTQRLDAAAGRTLLAVVNEQYSLSLKPDEGPYAILLPKHPADEPSREDRAVVVSFSRQSPDEIAAALDDLRDQILSRRRRGGGGDFWRDVVDGFNAGTGGLTRMFLST